MTDLLLGPTRVLEPLPQTIKLPTRSFSFSQFRTVCGCAACYFEKYVVGRPSKTSTSYAIGNAIHKPIEFSRKRRLDGKPALTQKEIEDIAAQGFDDTINGVWRDGRLPDVPPITKYTKEEQKKGFEKALGEAKDKGIALAVESVPILLAAEADYELLGVEVPIDFTGVFPFPILAYADAVLRDPMDWSVSCLIKDTKSSAKDALPDAWNAGQLGLYKMPYWMAGEEVAAGIDMVLKTSAPDWEKINKMRDAEKRDKATEDAKRFHRVHLWTEPGYSLVTTDAQMEALRRRIIHAAQQINDYLQDGYFPPNLDAPFGEHDFPDTESHDIPGFVLPIDGFRQEVA